VAGPAILVGLMPDATAGGVSPRWGLGWTRGHPLLGLTPQAIDDRRFAAGGGERVAGPIGLIGVTPDAGPEECSPLGLGMDAGHPPSWGLRPWLLTIAALRLGREHSHAHGGGPSVGAWRPASFAPLGLAMDMGTTSPGAYAPGYWPAPRWG
jgi:hypothetical protein